MDHSQVNSQLELCCRVGSLDGILEALAEGADINHNGGTPLFTAIMAHDHAAISLLLENGADASVFLPDGPAGGDAAAALLALAPAPGAAAAGSADSAEVVDAKLVRALDRMIRREGLAAPIAKGRGADYPAFSQGLKWIAAEECHSCVMELLAMIESAGIGAEDGAIAGFLRENAARIGELSERYMRAEEVPGDLLRDYLKEKRKLRD